MENKNRYIICILILQNIYAYSLENNHNQKLLAFPSAEGGGAYSVGGRSGKIYFVTNLNSKGPGSLREACQAKGPRTVIFRVGGTIDLNGKDIVIKNDNITIAGQTATGEGIQIKNGGLSIKASDVIIRYLRIRPGPASSKVDALDIKSPSRHERKKNIIIDHVSAFWGVDETMNAGDFSDNVTLQWSIIAEGLNCSVYSQRESWKVCKSINGKAIWNHSRGSKVGSDSRNISIHHNLFYRNYKRNPLVQSSSVEVINNVMVNYQYQAFVKPYKEKVFVNFIGNYFRSYIHKRPPIRVFNLNKGYDGKSKIFYKDNYDSHFRSNSNQPETDIRVVHFSKEKNKLDGDIKDSKRAYPFSKIKIDLVHSAYEKVIKKAGANYPKYDSADQRVLDFVKTGKAPKTLIDDPSEVGGWPSLLGKQAPLDSDNDGIPDNWEKSHGLNFKNPKDGNSKTLSPIGYTNLEVYMNGLVE